MDFAHLAKSKEKISLTFNHLDKLVVVSNLNWMSKRI